MKKLLVFAVAALIAVGAMAQTQGTDYDWWNTTIEIDGSDYDVTTWSTAIGTPTDLGTIDLIGSIFQITAASMNVWSDSLDRGGANMFFNTFVDSGSGPVADAAGQDVWLGALTSEGANNYSLIFSTPTDIGTTVLADGDVVTVDLWAKTYGTSGDEWLTDGGNNYHGSFTVGAAPVPEPATMTLLGLGALAMVLRRKMRK